MAGKDYFNIVLVYGDEIMSFHNDMDRANAYLKKHSDPDEAFAENADCKQTAEFDASSGVLIEY